MLQRGQNSNVGHHRLTISSKYFVKAKTVNYFSPNKYKRQSDEI